MPNSLGFLKCHVGIKHWGDLMWVVFEMANADKVFGANGDIDYCALAYEIICKIGPKLNAEDPIELMAKAMAEGLSKGDESIVIVIKWFSPIFERFGIKEKTLTSFVNLFVSTMADEPMPSHVKRKRGLFHR